MGDIIKVQEPITLTGDTTVASESLVASESAVIDVRRYTDAVFTIRTNMLKLSGSDTVQFEIYTSPVADPKTATGSGNPSLAVRVGSVTAARTTVGVSQVTTISTDTSSNPLQGYIWWKVIVNKVASSGPWSINFEIWGSFKP